MSDVHVSELAPTVHLCDTMTGNEYQVAFCKDGLNRDHDNDGTLFLQLWTYCTEEIEDDVVEYWMELDEPMTVELNGYRPYRDNIAMVNVVASPYLPQFLEEHGFAKPTGTSMLDKYGNMYFEYEFDMDEIRKYMMPESACLMPRKKDGGCIYPEIPYEYPLYNEDDDDEMPF